MNTPSFAKASRLAIRTVVVRISRKLKATYRLRTGRLFSHLLLAMVAAVTPQLSYALPQGVTVQAGKATVRTPDKSQMVIDQGSNKAILDWRSFSIGRGQSVVFRQPGASSVALNRVTGGEASSIYGNLSANGQVFLTNSAGVLFAPGAQVNVGGLVASSLDMRNADFMAGKYRFSGSGGSVVNQGSITGGYVALAGGQVTNSGSIHAPTGAVGLLAGSRVTVDASGAGLVSFSVDAGAVDAAIRQAGTITADGGSVLLAAKTLSDAMPTVINQSGVIRADSIAERNGTIVLSGGGSGVVDVAGRLQARGDDAGETGGTVKVLGDRVALRSVARVDADGAAGGGTVLVGGNFQGKGPEQNASITVVEQGATLSASATQRGDGGRLIVWADGHTHFAGQGAVRGAGPGGDGGFAEVSGKQTLAYRGSVDARGGAGGANGRLLLDPKNLTIGGVADIDGNGTTGDDLTSSQLLSGDYAGVNSRISAGAVVAQLATADLILQAGNDLTVNSAVNSGSGRSLTLQAGRSVQVHAPVTMAGSGNITMIANNVAAGETDAAGAMLVGTGSAGREAGRGEVHIGSTGSVTSVSGNIKIASSGATSVGGTPGGVYVSGGVSTTGDITLAGTDVAVYGTGSLAAGGWGSITANGTGDASRNHMGVTILGLVTAQDGDITITGVGGGVDQLNAGLSIWSGGKVLTTGAGNISLTGTGGAGAGYDYGIYFANAGSQVSTSGTGSITLTGTGGGSAANGFNFGVFILEGATVQTGSGNITVSGTGGAGNVWDHGIYLGQGAGSRIATASGDILIGGASTHSTGITLNATNSVEVSGAGNITFRASSPQRGMALSGDIGGATMHGDILLESLNGGMTLAGTIVNDRAAGSDVMLRSGGVASGIVQSGGQITTNGLAVLGTGAVDLRSGTNSATTFAVSKTEGDVDLAQAGTLIVGTVGATSGIATSGNVTLAAIGADADLVVDADIAVSSSAARTVILRADRDVLVGEGADAVRIRAAGPEPMNVVLNADRDAVGGGVVRLNADGAGTTTVSTNGGSFLAHGGTATDVRATGWGASRAAGVQLGAGTSIATGGGTIAMYGQGWSGANATATSHAGVAIAGSSLASAGGGIIVDGVGGTRTGGGTGGAHGVAITAGSTLASGTGGVTVVGLGGMANGVQSAGVHASSGAAANAIGGTGATSVLLQAKDGSGIVVDDLVLQANATGGIVTLSALGGGTIDFGADSTLQTDALRLHGTGATVATLASTNTVKRLAASLATAGSSLDFAQAGDLAIGSVTSVTTVGSAASTANGLAVGGAVAVSSDGTLSTTHAVTTTGAGGNVGLTGKALTLGAAVNASGTTAVTASDGVLTQMAAGDITSDGAVTLAGTGGILSAGDVTTTNAGITYADDLTLTGDVVISGGTGSKSLLDVSGAGHDLSFGGTGTTAAGLVSGVGLLTATNGLTLSNALTADEGMLAGTVSALGMIHFSGDVTLAGATTLHSTLGAVYILGSVLGANHNLTVNSRLFTQLGNDTGNATLGVGTLDVSAGGGIQLGASVASTGAQRYRSPVTLLADTVLATTAATTTSADIIFDGTVTGGGFDLAVDAGTAGLTLFSGAASGLDWLTIAGAATQTASLSAAGLQLSGKGNVTLANAGNAFATIAADKSAGDIRVHSSTSLAVGTLATTGVVTDGDVVLSVGDGNIALGADLDAGAGDVTLSASGNITRSAGTVSASAVGLYASGNVAAAVDAVTLSGYASGSATLSGNATTLDGFSAGSGFSLTNTGGLTVAGSVTGGTGLTRITTTAGSLVVDAYVGGTGVSLGAGTGGSLALNAVVAAGTGTATLTADVDMVGTAARVTGAAAQLATTSGDITDLVVDVSGAVTLRAQSGSIAGLELQSASADAKAGGSIDAAIVTGALTGSAGTSASFTGNATSLGAFATGTGFTLADSGGLVITGAVVGGSGATTISTTGALAIGGDVSGSGVSLVGTGLTQVADTTVNAGAGSITLDANDGAIVLAGALTTTSNTATAVRILDATTAALGSITTGATGTVVIGGAGTDNLSGAVTQAAGSVITAGTVTVNSGGSVTLANANKVGSLGPVTSSGGFSFNDSTGGLALAGAVVDAAGAVTIGTTGGALTLGTHDVRGVGVRLAGTGVTQGAGSAISAGAGTVLVDGNDGAIALAGSITTTSNSATAVRFLDAASAVIGSVNAGNGTVVIGGAGSDAIAGAVQQSGTTTINAATLMVNAEGAATLTNANSVGNLAGATSDGDFAFTNAGALNVTGLIDAGSGGVAITTTSGALQLAAAGDIEAGGPVTLTGAGGIRTAGDIATSNDDVTFNGATTLTGAVDIAAGSGAVSFSGAVGNDGTARNLTLDATGGVTAGGAISGIATLTTTSGTDLVATSVAATSANLGGDVRTSGVAGQAFGSLALTGDVTLDAGAANAIGLGTVTGNGHDLTVTGLATTTGATDLGALVANQTLTTTGAVDATSVAVTGVASLGGDVTTTGSAGQTYGSTTLTADVTLDAGAANAIGLGAVTGNGNDLTLTGLATTTGATDLGVLVASQTLTTTGAVDATSVAVTGAASLGGDVTTTGSAGQAYGSTTLTTDVTLDAGAANAIDLGTATGNANDLTLTGRATTSGIADLGALLANQSLATTGAVQAASVTVTGTAALGGDVTTAGAQSYGAIGLAADVALQGSTLDLGTVTGNGNDLALAGTATAGSITGIAALQTAVGTELAATRVAADTATLGGDVTTTGTQAYGATRLAADVALAGSRLSLGDVAGNGHDLTLAGDTSAGAVRSVDRLTTRAGSDIAATSVAANAATLGGNVTTTGAAGQAYGTTTLTSDVVLDAGARNAIALGAVTGNRNDLLLVGRASTTGAAGIGALVARQQLATTGTVQADSVTVASAASLGGDVRTRGAQSYGSTALQADVTLAGRRLALGDVAGNGNELVLAGATTAGRISGVDSLRTTAGSTLAAASVAARSGDFGGDVRTTGTQAYERLATSSGVQLAAASLTAGRASLGGGVTTAGAQRYAALEVSGDVRLRSTGGGAIAMEDVTGGGDLAVQTGGRANFGGTVAVGSLDADARGGSTLSGDVSTSRDQRWRNDIDATGLRSLSLNAGGMLVTEGAIATNPAMNLHLRGDAGVRVDARGLGEVDVLSLASANGYVHLTHGREAHGGQGVLARGGLVIDAPHGQLNFPPDLLRLHPLTPSVTTIAAPLGVWIESALAPGVLQVTAAQSFETDRYLRRMLRRDAGLLAVEDLALRTNTSLDALVAPTLADAPRVRQPDCLPEQGRGQPCLPATK